MMLRFDNTQITVSAIEWWIIFYLLARTISDSTLLPAFGFVTLLFLPGLLTLFGMKYDFENRWFVGLVLAAGISLFELMIVGLLGNMLLPMIGITDPLRPIILLTELTGLIVALCAVTWVRPYTLSITISSPRTFDITSLSYVLLSALFVPVSIMGAVYLNTGGTGSLALALLIAITLLMALLVFRVKYLKPYTVPVSLFFISLSLLFMTSLRGVGIVGHDIQREFLVFELTKQASWWSIAAYRDAYNACLSITILPTLFASLLKIPDPYVYKVLFQIIFASVPSILYLHFKRYAASWIALLSTFYFIAFPTFFIDMPFLNRQEIAFLFLVLMVFTLFDDRLPRRIRDALAILFGLGMVVSHYSTTYIVTALIAFVVIARPFVNRLGRASFMQRLFPRSGFALLHTAPETPRITILLVAALAGASFFWSSILTDTSSNSLYRVVAETVRVIQHNANETTQSGDVLYSLFSWKKIDTEALLREYEQQALEKVATYPEAYYPTTLEETHLTSQPATIVPLTTLGRTLASKGFDVPGFQHVLHQTSAKLLQVLLLIGLIATLLRRRFLKRSVPTDILLLSGGSVLLLVAIIALPVLSVEYGLLRAFQQSLIFLAPFVVIGSIALVAMAHHRARMTVAATLGILFFLSSTGTTTELLGGYDPLLHFSNTGAYFERYYVHDSERAAFAWLMQIADARRMAGEGMVIQSDNIALNAAFATSDVELVTDLYPPLIRKDAYVFLGVSEVALKEATLSYNETQLTYVYPLGFLDTHKTLVYDAGGVRIYR